MWNLLIFQVNKSSKFINFWGEVLFLLGIYDILPVFLTQLQYFFNCTYSVALAQPYQNNYLAQ